MGQWDTKGWDDQDRGQGWGNVKYVLSDPTKVQIDWGWNRIDVMDNLWEKDPKEGCHEIEQA